MAIDEVVDWTIVPRANSAVHPVGPQGREAARISLSFQELQGAIARWRDTVGGGAAILTGPYRFDASTATAPGSGKVRFDTGAYGTVTELFISDTSDSGGDATNFLAALSSGDQIYIQETKNAGSFSVWTVSGAVTDEGNWFRVPVNEGVNGDFLGSNSKITVALAYSSGSGGGAWITPPFSAGDFTANGSMTWTVESGDVATYAYTITAKTMTVAFAINSSTVGGTPSTVLQIAIPASKTATKLIYNVFRLSDNGSTAEMGLSSVAASGTVINLALLDGTNWSAATNTTVINGQITFEID